MRNFNVDNSGVFVTWECMECKNVDDGCVGPRLSYRIV